MKIKNSSKDWAESRGGVLIGTPLKPIHRSARETSAFRPGSRALDASGVTLDAPAVDELAQRGQPGIEAEILWALRETGDL